MRTKSILALEDLERMTAAAESEALANHWPVSIAIVDDGGHPLWFMRLDGAAPATALIALAKARTAAIGRRDTKFYEDLVNGGRAAILSAPFDAMFEGGVPIIVGGDCLGAVGVSGVDSDQDAQIAKAAIAAL